jgi:hypothetical protein
MCEQRELVLDYLYDEASPDGRREMERHLEACDDCRDDARAFRRVREDLLAWDVPNPPSVWTPFAPAPVVALYRQVPAWAMAAAAGLMFVIGGAGASVAVAFNGGSGLEPASMVAAAPAMTAGPGLDADAIAALVRREVSSAGAQAMADTPTPLSPATRVAFRLDPEVERRLVAQTNQLVGASEEQVLRRVGEFLREVALDAERQRRDDGQRLTALQLQVDQLHNVLSQLVLAQTKVQ